MRLAVSTLVPWGLSTVVAYDGAVRGARRCTRSRHWTVTSPRPLLPTGHASPRPLTRGCASVLRSRSRIKALWCEARADGRGPTARRPS
eukprot:1445226-Prymnesium_polylepis.1